MNWTTHGSADGARIVPRAASRTHIAAVLPHAAARDAAAFEGRAQAETGRIGGAGGWIIPPGEVKGVPLRGAGRRPARASSRTDGRASSHTLRERSPSARGQTTATWADDGSGGRRPQRGRRQAVAMEPATCTAVQGAPWFRAYFPPVAAAGAPGRSDAPK